MIIDAHMHLGDSRASDMEVTEDEVLRSMDKNQVHATIVQPFPSAADVTGVHKRIWRFAKRHPGRIYGLASINPHIPKQEYLDEATRCVELYGFVALKLHTLGHVANPLGRAGATVFETAATLGIPVMVHTGLGLPFAAPALVIPRAREHPKMPIILAHAGFAISTLDAYVAAKECPNLYLEPSWCMTEDIGWLIRELGANRVMLGSDRPGNTHVELAKIRGLGLSKDDEDMVLGRTAAGVFKLPT